MQNRKNIFAIILFGILLTGIAYAGEDFNETKKLIDSNISCDKLTDGQLEEMGDYYMEQMHPGEAHELMHKMMGGEDSSIVKQMHTNMAETIYCKKENTQMKNMMSMMMGNNENGMMSMMGGNRINSKSGAGNYGSQMMGNFGGMMSGSYGSGIMWYGWLNGLLVTIILILMVVWLIKQIQRKR